MVFDGGYNRGISLDYQSGDKPALLISTLEALAVLMALKLYYVNVPRKNVTAVTLVTTSHDTGAMAPRSTN